MNDVAEIGSHLAQLAVAFSLALPIAWDREQSERSAGLRTFTLVAISTCGFLIAARSSFGGSVDAESRVWQGLLTGIGFVGSGAIIKTERERARHRDRSQHLEHGCRRGGGGLQQLRHRGGAQCGECRGAAVARAIQGGVIRRGAAL